MFCYQIDQRVANQLAAAHEQQLISKDSQVHLKVEDNDLQQPIIKRQ